MPCHRRLFVHVALLATVLCTIDSVTAIQYDSSGVETAASIQATCTSSDRALWSTWDLHVCRSVASAQPACWPQRRVSLCPPESFAGVVVLFHAFTECPKTQELVAADLQRRCFDVLIPLLPGHGGKPCSQPSTTCLDGLDTSGLPSQRAPYVAFVDTINTAMGEAVEERLAMGSGRTAYTSQTCDIQSANDFEAVTECGYYNITVTECQSRGCCWSNNTCFTPPTMPFVIGVGGESTGGALATLAAARSSQYTRQVVVNGFYGVTEARLDRRVEKCLHGNLGLVECLVETLTNYEGLDAQAAATVGPVVSQFLSVKLSDYPVHSYNELQRALREVLESFVEQPSSLLQPLLESSMTWGGYCLKSLTSAYGGAGICTFQIRHLLAAHSVAQFALRSARYSRVKDSQFILVESDGVSRNSLSFTAARRIGTRAGTQVFACMYWEKDNCEYTPRNHECGVPHLALNTAKASAYPPSTSYWMNGLVSSIAGFYANGLPVGQGTWDKSNNVCVQESLDNPSPGAGPVMQQAEVVVTQPSGGPLPPPENLYDSVHDSIITNTGLGDEEGGSVSVEPPIDDSDAEKGDAPVRGGFEVFKSPGGEIYFRLKAANYRIILASEGYSQISGAENGIRSVITHAADSSNFQSKQTDAGYSFTLVSPRNGQIIARSQVYTSAQGRDNGIVSVQTNAANGVVKYLDGLDEGGVFRIFKSDKDGKYYFSLKSSNGQVIGRSQGYTTKYSAKKGILSVRNNAIVPSRFAHATSASNQYYFNLKAGNGRTILTSEMYNSKESAENGAGAITRLAAKAIIKDESNPPARQRRRRAVLLQGSSGYVISCDADGKYYFALRDVNGQDIVKSDPRPDFGSAETGLIALINVVQDANAIQAVSDTAFVVRASNTRILARSPSFPTAAASTAAQSLFAQSRGLKVVYQCEALPRAHAGRFVLKKNKASEFYFNLVSRNGRKICTSEGYGAKTSAANGIDSVRANSQYPARFILERSRNGRYYFNLKARNGQVICTSQLYSSRSSAASGIGAVMRLASVALHVDETVSVQQLTQDTEQEKVMVSMPVAAAHVYRDMASDRSVGSVEGLALATITTGNGEVVTNGDNAAGGEGEKTVSLMTFVASLAGVTVVAVATIVFLLVTRRRSRSSASSSAPMAGRESHGAADDGTEL